MPTTAKPWKVGDPCPNDGSTLVPCRRPSDAEQRAATRTDNPGPATLPPTVDSASAEQHAELGDLWRCPTCGYQSRVQPEAKPADAGA